MEEKLTELVKAFVADNKIHCPETIHQTDRVMENASEFIERLVEIVGYLPDDGDEA